MKKSKLVKSYSDKVKYLSRKSTEMYDLSSLKQMKTKKKK